MIRQMETDFLFTAGVIVGSIMNLQIENKTDITIELITIDAIKTSEIEGEILDRKIVQSSIQKQMGLLPMIPIVINKNRE